MCLNHHQVLNHNLGELLVQQLLIYCSHSFLDDSIIPLCFGHVILRIGIVYINIKVVVDGIHQALVFAITVDSLDVESCTIIFPQYHVDSPVIFFLGLVLDWD